MTKVYDDKVDLYPIGVMMFELLIGDHPIEVDCDLDMWKIDNQAVEKLLEKEKITPSMIEFIMRCIEKDPKKRYSWMNLFTHKLFNEGIQDNREEPKQSSNQNQTESVEKGDEWSFNLAMLGGMKNGQILRVPLIPN